MIVFKNHLEGSDTLPGPWGFGIWTGKGNGQERIPQPLETEPLRGVEQPELMPAPFIPPKQAFPSLQRKMGNIPETSLSF